jgi:hypothetical protein
MEETVSRVERKSRPSRSAAEWRKEVQAWKKSGVPAAEYAAKHDLNASTLMWWSSATKRGGYGSREGARGGSGRARKRKSVAFLPVRVREPATQAAAPAMLRPEILLQGGRRVRIAEQMSLEQFVRLLDAIEGGARC